MLITLISCSQKATEEAPQTETVTYPAELSYKGNPSIGDRNNVKTVMECNKRLTELNTDIGEFLADSVTMYLADGMEINGPKDSVLVLISDFITSLSGLKIDYVAAMPVNNDDLHHEWVFTWTEETYTYKDGKVEKRELHEDYRMEGGKIREIFQYARSLPGAD